MSASQTPLKNAVMFVRLILNQAIVDEPHDGHPHNPNAEREARIAAEGLYSDPIQPFVKLDEDEQTIEMASPDFEL